MTKKLNVSSRLYMILVFLFLYLPILVLIVFSFNESKSHSNFTGFTLKWYEQLFQNRMILSSLGVTLLVAIISAVAATFIGTAAAVGMHNMKQKPRMLIKNITYVPVVNPEIVTGVSFMLLFVMFRYVFGSFYMGFWTLAIAHITFNIPYVIFSVSPKLRQMNANLYEAALDLGCSPVQAFIKVVVPEIMPGIATGFLMALTYSIDDFVISYFTAGTVQTLPITIYSMTRRNVSPQINALSTVLFVVVLTILLLMNIKDIKSERKMTAEQLRYEQSKEDEPIRPKRRGKIILPIGVAFIVLVTVVALFKTANPDPDIGVKTTGISLEVYNWGEYISDGSGDSLDVIAEFERRTGISVHYTNFATNEEMHTKIAEGGVQYDVIIPSDYMIARMIEEDMLDKLDYSNIPNAALIDEAYKGLEYDRENAYSVPYMYGLVGIIYNTAMVNEEITSWDALWDEKYAGQILMFNNSRDAFGISLARLGYSMNTTDPAELAEAAQALKEQKKLVQAYVMDEIFNKMGGGEAAIAPYYVGDAITMMDENPDLAFVIPEEGTNFFVDAMVIPKGCKNKAAAEAFINFMCDPEISAANAEYIGYSTPIPDAQDMLDLDDETFALAYPGEDVLRKTEVFKQLPEETNVLISEHWIAVKSYDENANVWIAPVFLIAAVAASVVITIVRSRKRKRESY